MAKLLHKFYLCIALLLFSSVLFAQNKTLLHIKGIVIDQQGVPIVGANVTAIAGDKKFGNITDKEGQFSIKLNAANYKIEISFIGYTSYNREVKLTNKDINIGKITLTEDHQLLNAVKVKGASADMKVKGDTLEFSAGNFGMKEGDVLEDLIKKIPGAEIDKNGKITVNGKEIKQIMVDGKEFFSGDNKIASKNLPTDVIDKVQILQRLSEMSRMTGFNDGEEESVINITIKKNMKKGLFGSVFGGLGNSIKGIEGLRYETNATINSFRDNYQFSIIGGFNNTNNKGFLEIGDNSTSNIMGGGRGRMFGMNSGNSGIINSFNLGANASTTIKDILELGGNGRYGYTDQFVHIQKTDINFIPNKTSTKEDNTSWDNTYTHSGGANMRFVWKPNKQTEIVYTPSISLNKANRFYNNTFSNINQNDNTEINHGTYKGAQQSQYLSTDHRLSISKHLNNEGRTISASLFVSYNNNDKNLLYNRELIYANNNEAGEGLKNENALQREKNISQNITSRLNLSYVEPITSNLFLQTIINTHINAANSNRTNYNIINNNEELNTTNSGKYKNSFYTFDAGTNLKYIIGKADITFGFTLTPSIINSKRYKGVEHKMDTVLTTLNFAPTIGLNYKFSKTQSLRFFYRGRSSQPSINQLMPMPDNTNPLRETIGNPNLKPSFSHNFFGNYNGYYTESKRSISMHIYGRFEQNAIVSNVIYDIKSGKQTITYTNANGQANVGLHFSFTSPVYKDYLSVRANFSNNYARIPSLMDGVKNINSTNILSTNMAFIAQNDWLYTSINYGYNNNRYQNTASNNDWVNINNFSIGNETTLKFPFGLNIGSDINYSTNNGYNVASVKQPARWNLSTSYSFLKNKEATIRIKIYDIFNAGADILNTSTPMVITHQITNTLSRFFMVHFVYKFNYFSGGAKKEDMKDNINSHKRHYLY